MAPAFFSARRIVSARRILVALLLLTLIGAGAGWFLANFEPVAEKVWAGYRGKARRDPWLAAERLLERMDLRAAELRALPELRTLPPSALLVLPEARQTITPQLREGILAWVGRGGNLIIEAEEINQPDPLLDALGVRRSQVEIPQDDAIDEREDSGLEIIEIALPQGQPPVKVLMIKYLTLDSDAAVARFGGAHATAVLLLGHGRGRVVVVNDLDSVSNYLIGKHDHAEFLWRLARLDANTRDAYFFNNPQRLSLLDWLRANAWPALAGGALLLALWLWRVAPRFGPVAPDPERVRRRLLDHLRASGRFLWANGGARQLLEAAREACLRRVARAHPDLLAAPESERAPRLAGLLGLTAEQARVLLAPAAATRMIDFLQTVRLYQTVHERLSLRRTGKGRIRRMA